VSTIRYRQVETPAGMIDLGLGQPDDSVFPRAIFARAAERMLAAGAPVDQFQYGAEYGDGHHRVALAEFLTAAYGLPVDPECLFTSNGNSQALDLVCTAFTRHGDTVIVEEPSYHLARGIFTDHGLRVIDVPVDADGLDPEAVAAALSSLAAAGTPARFVYTIPAHHNPTAVTMTAERREKLVAVTAGHGCLLVADEVYHLLTYTGSAPPSFSQWVGTGSEHVLCLGTFSKILAPGLRLGWVHAAPALLARLVGTGVVTSGGGLNPFTSALVTAVIGNGDLAANIAMLCDEYAARLDALDSALHEHLPSGVSWQLPTGGYFVWLTLPDAMDGADVRRRAPAAGVDVREGALFSILGGQQRTIRLSFAHYLAPDLREGARRLGAVLARR
jgi:DNA-binding transcriptional MocR family regulator